MDVRLLVLSLFFLVSCLPEAQVGKSNISNSGNTTTGSTTGGVIPPGPNRPVQWNYLNQDTTTITISVQNLQTSYIGGSQIETFLSIPTNYVASDYCTITRYSVAGEKRELRTRSVPFQYTDFTLGRLVKIFRVDFHDLANSQELCNKAIPVRVQSPTSLQYVPDAGVPPLNKRYNHPEEVCDGCAGVLQSTSVAIYKKTKIDGVDYLDKIQETQINTQNLQLQIDPHGEPGGGAGTCTNNSCQAINLDCCLDNQCVRDGVARPGMDQTSLYQSVEAQRVTNPLIYIQYPQVYYVCGSAGSTTGGTTTGGGTTGSTTGGTTGGSTPPPPTRRQKDYACIEHIKGQTSSVPYHQELSSGTYTPATSCLTAVAEKTQDDHYLNSFKRLYQHCGCTETDIDRMLYNCPNYEYKVTGWETIGTETRPSVFECSVVQPPGPLPTERTVQVNSRSAPHRFFSKTGQESATPIAPGQEGDEFSYLDPDDKTTPDQKPLSMNAILGQMSVGLSQAQPAKALDVELDKVYFLTTNRGTYSPCPTCGKDSWINSFSAYPTTTDGIGIQSVGFTTKRDEIGTNITQGNYEDTIFGRACWVPPTMLPFSHTPGASRETRLKAQSALFANGYQRDWFGFNKGSLIGSFDGVTWFAIGKGRIVRSSSTKLFLAINAPFADLANPSIHEVFVQNFNGITPAASVDYDPQYHQHHTLQNEAGNCQRHHMCETDKDCITALGWEYSCADVRDLKTYAPSFDVNGKEFSDTASLPVTIDQILQQKQLPSSASKRCVYRGAGSICGKSNIADLNKKKLLTCAPNFFCAGFAQPYHNTEIARFAVNLDDTPLAYSSKFGKAARVLGRPLDYIGTKSLSAVESTIGANIRAIDPAIGSLTGLCQPGKALPSASTPLLVNPFEQHKNADNFNSTRRADSINQIASCNASFFNSNRHTSCPVLNETGNYAMFDSATLPADYAKMASAQNSCGLESLDASANLTSSNLDLFNPFRLFEAKTSKTLPIFEKSLVQNACLRRAGSVCHTDLDCSPNSFHSEATGVFSLSLFGNQAERDYYAESLVCGQKDHEPYLSDAEGLKNYKMNQNVCCREVGQTLTTYTANIPRKINVLSTADYEPVSEGLKMSLTPGVAPNDPKRYSRLAIVAPTTPAKPTLSAAQNRNPSSPFNLMGPLNVNTPGQWETLAEVNSKTCCGGGWIRKFSDGSTDWKVTNRVHLDVTNFRCINSRTPLLTATKDLASRYDNAYDVESLMSRDHEEYCKSTQANGAGCAYYPVANELKDILPKTIPGATEYGSIQVRTIAPEFTGANSDFYFVPLSADSNPGVYADFSSDPTTPRRNISIRIPSYISRKDFDDAIPAIRMMRADGTINATNCVQNSSLNLADHTSPNSGGALCEYRYYRDARVLRVGFKTPVSGDWHLGQQIGITFTVDTAPRNTPIANSRTVPGSSSYYLKRLGQLELSGIPQITFEELYCNDNSDRLVPGIFKPTLETKTQFQNNTISFLKSYLDGEGVSRTKHFTNMHSLENTPVFSANEFKCCSPLGMKVSGESVCCSGFANTDDSTGQKTCALPSGANLMVYFNKFVSNEGRSLEASDGKLVDADFDAQTGEPKIVASVITKIRSLGTTYCQTGKVRQGGAFGEYPVIPNATSGDKLYNIVDSPFDIGQTSNAGSTVPSGYQAFNNGFKWNHHLYCDD